jgi:hypothetical protein
MRPGGTVERTKLQELARKLNNTLGGAWLDEVYAQARKEANVTTADLLDDDLENSARVKLYWTLVALLIAQVLSEAANQQAVYEGWNR